MACACKSGSNSQVKSVKQVVKKVRTTKNTTNKKVSSIRKVVYRRPI